MEANGIEARLDLADATSSLRESLGVLRPGGTPSASEEVREAATEFEAYFLKLLLGEMRKTLTSDALFSGEFDDGYQALMDDALARHAARSGGVGLADQLVRQWESRA